MFWHVVIIAVYKLHVSMRDGLYRYTNQLNRLQAQVKLSYATPSQTLH